MINISKSYKNEDGTEETLMINSDDDYEVKLGSEYKLANHNLKKESKFAKKFKGSILGADIGFKSGGFTNVAILASVIAIGVLLIMYFMWRF